MVADLREGWTYFRRTTWLFVVVVAFAALNAISSGAFSTLGPVLAIADRHRRGRMGPDPLGAGRRVPGVLAAS